MRPVPEFYHPPERERLLARATRLEWITVAYLLSVIAAMYVVAGSSQSMRAAWIEDMLSLVPPIAFLIATPITRRRPSEEFPFGYHRATSVAFFAGAVALFAMGGFLLIESLHKLMLREHPSIGMIRIFGRDIWLGWAMLAVLAYGCVPVWLGRLKTPLARSLHDHVLHVDAAMNRADWLTAAGEAFVVPADARDLVRRIRDAAEGARALDWRMPDLTIMPVESLDPLPPKNAPGPQ